MKRIIILLLVLLLTACGISNSKRTIIYEYYITINNIDIKPNMFYDTVKYTIGDPNHTRFDEENNRIYEYNGFEIKTHIINNIERIESITITNNEIHTNEGITIGNTLKDIKNTYGDGYYAETNRYVYNLNNTSLSFILDNDIIIEIEYHV